MIIKRKKLSDCVLTKKEKKKYETSKLVEYWCSLEGTRLHRPASKTYKKAIDYFEQFKKGIFYKNKEINYIIIQRFSYEKVNLLIRRKWDDKSLKKVLKNMSLIYREGYPPAKKEKIPRDLATLIYNPQRGSSWFINAALETPKPYYDRDIIVKDEEVKREIEAFEVFFGDIKYNKNSLIKGLQSLKDFYYKNIVDKTGYAYKKLAKSMDYGSFYRFCSSYRKWLDNQEWLDDHNVKMVSENSGVFCRYIKEIEKEFDVKLG